MQCFGKRLRAEFFIAMSVFLVGVVLMFLQWRAAPEFFRRKLETADADMRL